MFLFLMFLFICLFSRDTLVNTCTQYECKLHGFSDVISADSDRLSLCQKLPLDPSMADYVTSRRQHAFQMKTQVMVFKSMTVYYSFLTLTNINYDLYIKNKHFNCKLFLFVYMYVCLLL